MTLFSVSLTAALTSDGLMCIVRRLHKEAIRMISGNSISHLQAAHQGGDMHAGSVTNP
jgi:hypothetical protein